MGSVFPDDVVSDGAETGPPAQLPNGVQELWVQRQGKAIVLLSLQGQAVHLPSAKLPAMYVTQIHAQRKNTQHINATCRHIREKTQVQQTPRAFELPHNMVPAWRAVSIVVKR